MGSIPIRCQSGVGLEGLDPRIQLRVWGRWCGAGAGTATVATATDTAAAATSAAAAAAAASSPGCYYPVEELEVVLVAHWLPSMSFELCVVRPYV